MQETKQDTPAESGVAPQAHGGLRIPVTYCHTMAEVRQHIDALDDRIVALMAERSGYVAQAARIKATPDLIVDVPRIERIVQRVRHMSREFGAPEAVAEATYRAMIAASIEFETGEFARLKPGSAA
jgi:isochorismate pyruvate lyase